MGDGGWGGFPVWGAAPFASTVGSSPAGVCGVRRIPRVETRGYKCHKPRPRLAKLAKRGFNRKPRGGVRGRPTRAGEAPFCEERAKHGACGRSSRGLQPVGHLRTRADARNVRAKAPARTLPPAAGDARCSRETRQDPSATPDRAGHVHRINPPSGGRFARGAAGRVRRRIGRGEGRRGQGRRQRRCRHGRQRGRRAQASGSPVAARPRRRPSSAGCT